MTSFTIAPLIADKIEPYFRIAICDSPQEMRRYVKSKRNEVGVFVPNDGDKKEPQKLATIFLLRTDLNQINLSLQASRAGMLMGEVVATASCCESEEQHKDFYSSVASETTAIMLASMTNFVEKHFVGVEFDE